MYLFEIGPHYRVRSTKLILLFLFLTIFIREGVAQNNINIGGCSECPHPLYYLDGKLVDTSSVSKIKPKDIIKLEIYSSREAKEKFDIISEHGIMLIWIDKRKYKAFFKKRMFLK